MITLIHITEKQTGKILDYIPLGDFWDDNHHKSLKDTLEYFEFRTFGDKRYSQHLEKMNRIIIPDEDGTYIEFVIFHAIKYRLQSTIVIDVYAPASYLLLKKAKVIKPQRVSEYTASQHLGFALNGTEWRPGVVQSDKYRSLDIEDHTNPYAYIKRIADEFELEPRFRVETDGNKVVGRYVDLLERVGEWQGLEVEFGRDLLGIERKVDDSNVVTALIGLAPERDDGTRLEVFIEDEEALQRWGIPNPQTGELMHLIETYEPESTDQDMTIERLTELTRNELEKRINSVVEYTADVADLEKVPGMENKKIRFGDTIKIKDTGFNPPLYLEARVHTQDRSLSQPEKKKVTLGDYIEYTEEEVHAIWKQLQAEIAKKVSMAEVTEVVYTKPEVDERDNAVREHADNVAENAKIEAIQVAAEDASQKAKQAEDSAKEYTDGRLQNTVAKDIFENTVTDLLNNIAQKVDSTRFEQVESELRGIAEDLQHEVAEHAEALEEHGGKITKLETDVDEVEGKISTTIAELQSLEETVSRHETQIEANAQAIALKADKQELDLLSGTVSDINSELSVMAGKIEAKAERSEVEKLENDVSKVSQDVSKLTIDVDGIKTNVSSISQTVSNHGTQISNINSTLTQHANLIASKVDATTYQQDKNGIITRIESAESRITQTENAIQTKVEKSEFDSVTNSLGNRISTIEQTADGISLEVSNIKANVYTKSEVDSAIDNIQVGGRNYARELGGDNYNINRIYNEDRKYTTIVTVDGKLWLKQSGYNYFRLAVIPIEPNTTYTWSFNVYKTGSERQISVYQWDGGSYGHKHYNVGNLPVRIKHTFTSRSNSTSEILHLSNLGTSDEWYFSDFKLEKGNKATDWTPAPEDIDERFTDIEGTLVSHSTKIEQNAQQIQLRATKAEVDTLTNRISSVEGELNLMPDKISSRIAETAIGLVGSNLIPNGSFELDHFGWESGGTIVDEGHSGSKSLRVNALPSGYQRKHLNQLIPVIPGRTYEISFWVKTSSDCNGTADNQKLRIGKKDGSLINQATFGWDGARTEWTRFSRLWTVPSDITEIQVSIVNNHTKGWVQWDDISIVDVTNENEVRQYAESQITQLAGQIQLRATKTEVDALTGRVSTVESTIQQHADMIESKIDDGQARSIFRQEVDSFTFDADQINFKGHIFGEDAIFMGSIGTPMLTVGAEDITGYENFGLRLQTAQWQPDVNKPFKKTGHIEFNTLNNGLEIIKYNLDHSTGFLDYFEVYARAFRIWGDVYVGGNGWVYTASIDFPVGYATGQNIYLRPANSDAEVRATVTGTTNQYVKVRAREFVAGGINGDGIFSADNSIVILRAGPDSYTFVQSDLEVRATRRFSGSSYIPVRASSFPSGSLEEFKTNIKKWEESALDIIRNSDIYEFNLKNDLEVGKNKKRYGLVIGDGYRTPEEVIDGDGVEQYAMNSISWKAIQELDTEQQELKGRIAWLEAENKLLREKIKKLEGMIS